MSRTTCSILSSSALGASANSRCGLVEKEHEFRSLGIADLGHHLEQLGQQPQQERGVKARALHQPVGG